MSYFGATGTPVLNLGFKARVGSALFACFVEANVLYIT